ncbi:MAG: DUF421 domain-containing protein [Anaerolineaceae bacterium]|nr:DUF421 domain-containing protein [Anaerolineaceae bacterium]
MWDILIKEGVQNVELDLSQDFVTNLLNLGIISLHTLIIYAFLIFCLSQLNHRLLAQVNFDELLIIALLGSAVETSMIAGNTSLAAGIVSASTLFASDWILSRMVDRWGWLRRLLMGHPILLVCQGNLLTQKLHEANLSKADVLESIRNYGYETIEQVKLAVLEIDGSISVVPKEDD